MVLFERNAINIDETDATLLETCYQIYSTAGASFPIGEAIAIAGHGRSLIWDSWVSRVRPMCLMERWKLNGWYETSFALVVGDSAAIESVVLHYPHLGYSYIFFLYL